LKLGHSRAQECPRQRRPSPSAAPTGDSSGDRNARGAGSHRASEWPQRPGLAISYLALVDGLILLTVALMGVSLIIREPATRQGAGDCATLVVSLLVLWAHFAHHRGDSRHSVYAIFAPGCSFGTLAYLAIFGFFNRGEPTSHALPHGTQGRFVAVVLILAQQRSSEPWSCVADHHIFVANVVISFCTVSCSFPGQHHRWRRRHRGGSLAAVWAIVFLIGSIPAVIRALRPDRV